MNRNTKVLTLYGDERDRTSLETAANCIREGGLVALPTETVYGIGANALDPEAVKQIFQAKGRPQDNPLIVHIADIGQAEKLVQNFPSQAQRLAECYWPGPLTMILPKSSLVPEVVSGGLSTVALRMPAFQATQELIRLSSVPVAAPSANLSGKPSPTTAQHCIDDLSGRVDFIVDGGPCPVGVESTVVTLASNIPTLLRPGAVTLSQLQEVLGEVVVDPAVLQHIADDTTVSSPGMKYKHYAPKAQLSLVKGTLPQFVEFLQQHSQPDTYALVFDGDLSADFPVPVVSYGPEDNSALQAQKLFEMLRQLDEIKAVKVYARTPSKTGMGLAVYNRLVRAAGFSEITL